MVVRIGPKKGRIYHCILLSVAALCYVLFAASTAFSPWHFLFLLAFSTVIKTRIICLSQQRARGVASDVGSDVYDFFIYQYLV